MTDFHIDHILVRCEGTHVDGLRLEEIVGRALELAAERLDSPHGVAHGLDPLTVDFRAMSNESIARVLADALVAKLEAGG